MPHAVAVVLGVLEHMGQVAWVQIGRVIGVRVQAQQDRSDLEAAGFKAGPSGVDYIFLYAVSLTEMMVFYRDILRTGVWDFFWRRFQCTFSMPTDATTALP